MLVDYEQVVLRLKERILAKSHHGQRDLLEALTQLEVECRMEEGLPERALRLYGAQFSRALVIDPEPSRVSAGVTADDHPARGAGSIANEEKNHVGDDDRGPVAGRAGHAGVR